MQNWPLWTVLAARGDAELAALDGGGCT